MSRGMRLLNALYTYPTVTIRTVKRLTGLSDKAAGDLVLKFVDLGILEEITGGRRNRRFNYKANTEILTAR